ncbi:hypothetical protein PIROE2DRAFT_3200 [Piromyces sp. E2]|nr:hypothetical protein PIROE2DRAFT_3200 [Piromyces sp. E2]|eukprot:OUM68971.1 hypothetical protein PIROE2DRAFT_3200 [Piromyces sp. E2]
MNFLLYVPYLVSLKLIKYYDNNNEDPVSILIVKTWLNIHKASGSSRQSCAALSLEDLRGLIATMVSVLENGHMMTYVTGQRH